MKESKIESYLVQQVKKIGGKAIKMVPTFENGIPDRQVLFKGRTIFVELKRSGEKPRPLQIEFMKQLEAHGFETRVIDSREQVDSLIENLLNYER